MVWEEIAKAKDENRCELVLSGEGVSQKIRDENGIDKELYQISSLNFLQISQTCLEFVDEDVSELTKLTSLVLHSNRLTAVPSSLAQLGSLKLLDVSHNQLHTIPSEALNMTNLHTLKLQFNCLKTLPSVLGMPNLHELLVSNNELTSLPDGVASLEHLHTIIASNNSIDSMPGNLNEMPQLKELDMAHNQLSQLPSTVSQCGKLKALYLHGNKFSDRKLIKLTNKDANVAKPVINFLKPLFEKENSSKSKSKHAGKGKEAGASAKQVHDDSDEEPGKFIQVMHCADSAASGLVVKLSPGLQDIRPHIVCCILRNLDFSKDQWVFKKFISMQTQLHETICQKRLMATIATHDLSAVKAPVSFEALDPIQTKLRPLGRQKDIKASEYMEQMTREAEAQRKQKKRNTVSGVVKYLDLLKGKHSYPFLLDATGVVISFPPITNCEVTKISENTKNMLIEVTSSKSLAMCKQVMEKIIEETLLLGVGTPLKPDEHAEPCCIVVEQVRVEDFDNNLKNVFPSKVDLIDLPYDILRE